MNTIQNKLDLSEDRKLSFIKKLSLIKKIDSIPILFFTNFSLFTRYT